MEDGNKKRRSYFKLSFLLGIVFVLIIFVISYLIYYNTVLDNESIFYNNILAVKNNYNLIFNDLSFNYDLSNNYTINGDLNVGNNNYKYVFTKNSNLAKKVFSYEDSSITSFSNNSGSYLNLSSNGDVFVKVDNKFNDFDYYNEILKKIKEDFNSYIYSSILDKNSYELFNQIYNFENFGNLLGGLKQNYGNFVTSDKYIRKVYFIGKMPVVEVNVVLDKSTLNKILAANDSNLKIKDNYEVVITMINSAITNDIEKIKVIVNNKTSNKRDVIEYGNSIINYVSSSGDKYNIDYQKLKNEIRIKKNNVLYGVVQMTEKNNTNNYSYKVIDKIYSIGLSVQKNSSKFKYKLETNIENVAKFVEFSGDYSNTSNLKNEVINSVSIDTLSNDQKNKFNDKIVNILK